MLTHSRHVEQLEDKTKKLQEQLEEANKVCAVIYVCVCLLSMSETVCVFHAILRSHTLKYTQTTGSRDSRYSRTAA